MPSIRVSVAGGWGRHRVGNRRCGGLGSFPKGRFCRKRPDPAGVTEEHLRGPQNASFARVAPDPGIMIVDRSRE